MGLENIKAVIFDKDGVLLDSLDTCYQAFSDMIQHFNLNEVSRDEFVKDFWGKKSGSNREKLEKNNSPSENGEGKAEYYHMRRKELQHMSKLYPGVKNMLAGLKGRYHIALVTNTEKSRAKSILDSFGILGYFDVIVGGECTKPKPSPDPILKACNEMGVEPSEALFVGDTKTDIDAGKSAGCNVAIVATSIPRKELDEIDGICVLDNIADVAKMLSN
ncbi:MAG: HAD family hydrolase [Candidatus Aenigmatarchaeota archaeon]